MQKQIKPLKGLSEIGSDVDQKTITLSELYRKLNTNENGLSSLDATERLRKIGPNKLIEEKSQNPIIKFFSYLIDILSLLLFFASLLAFLTNSPELGFAILFVIFLNAGFNFYQERQAIQAMKVLNSWIPVVSKVFRDRKIQKIQVENIVPGDIVVLEEGDRVPADARVIEASELYAIEIPLTGEFDPVNKMPSYEQQPTIGKNSIKDQHLTPQNMVFMSTSIGKGRGKVVVVSTGMNTRFGRIAHMTQSVKPVISPLQVEINNFAKYSFILSFLIGGVFFLISFFVIRLPLIDSLLFILGVMIACVPEGLQATITSALEINVIKMTRQNVLVKRLSAVESLGSVTMICTDKTGTITKGEMTVNKIWVNNKIIDVSGVGYHPKGEFKDGERNLRKGELKEIGYLLKIGGLCNTAKLQPPSDQSRTWSILGDATDGALLVAALKYGINLSEALRNESILSIFPFNSERKLMTTIHDLKTDVHIYCKGALRAILDRSSYIQMGNKWLPLSNPRISLIREINSQFAKFGLRVIAIAERILPKTQISFNTTVDRDQIENNLTILGLVAMKDPPRIEVKDAILKAKSAQIKINMITGDYGPTAETIAKEVGIIDENKPSVVLKGEELEKISDNELALILQNSGNIFSRVTPEHKLRIINVAMGMEEIVAVTGDGANDAPALRQASIGVAMGVTGTDIAKEAADIVLTDDSFTSIVHAIENGRNIWINLRKFIYYVYTHNWAELIPYVLFAILRTPLPLLAVHVLLIDLCIDIFPSIALSRDPPFSEIMKAPPRNIHERLFNWSTFIRSLIVGFVVGVIAFLGCRFTWIFGGWIPGTELDPTSDLYLQGTTMTYAIIVVGQIGNLFVARRIGIKVKYFSKLPSNLAIYWSILWQIGLLLLTIYTPGVQIFCKTAPLDAIQWLYILIAPFVVFVTHLIIRER